ncbi:MAG: O-antigen ligase family protein [Cyanobacteriota bacterium]|nr:O-antigen ligase family protein [Cyanobacteriota bacterium]
MSPADRQLLKMHRGQWAFLVGLVLLPSSALLGGLALLAALLMPGGRLDRGWDAAGKPAQGGWLLLSALLVLGAIGARSGMLAWVGLANWIPFFWAFWGFQQFLSSNRDRQLATVAIVSGSVPVLAIGLLQLVVGWQGPWQSLGGLFIWFLHDPDPTVTPRFTGIFENPNLSGAWLVMVWPLAMGLLLELVRIRPRTPRVRHESLVTAALTGLIGLSLLLSGSRNAISLGLLAVPLVLGWRCLRWYAPLAVAWLGAVWLAASSGAPPVLQQLSRLVVPATLWEKVARKLLSPDASASLAHRSREALWEGAKAFLGQLPPLGYGENGFRLLYEAKTGVYINHSHNLALEFVLSHGWLAAVLFLMLVALVLIGAWRTGITRGNALDRAWLAATLVTIGLHGWDIPSFDSRHNVLGWVLLAGVQAFRPLPGPTPEQSSQPSAASVPR